MATSQPTQEFVPIKEVRNGVVVLQDNSLRMVLMASSLNFALKSADEQGAILFQFQNFLNSLDFSVQFFIQSRRLDIRPYIALLEERKKEQPNELMKIQITEYIEFIKKFTESVSIMTKSFFIVIPYTPPLVGVGGSSDPMSFITKLMGKKRSVEEVKQKRQEKIEAFEENRTQLEQRASVVEQGISRTGIRIVTLGTEELVELYYKIFNPGEQEKPIALTAK